MSSSRFKAGVRLAAAMAGVAVCCLVLPATAAAGAQELSAGPRFEVRDADIVVEVPFTGTGVTVDARVAADPTRLVVDLAGASGPPSPAEVEVRAEPVQRFTVSQLSAAPAVMRVEVLLTRPAGYTIQADEGTGRLLLVISKAASAFEEVAVGGEKVTLARPRPVQPAEVGIGEAQPEAAGAASAPVASGPPTVTNVFDSTDIVAALRDVAAQTGVNIIADTTVQGYVTLELTDIPLEEALRMMLAPGGYTFRRIGGYYVVGSADVKNPAFPLLSTTEVIRLRNQKADDAARLLSEFFQPYVRVNSQENSLVVTGSPELVARVRDDVSKIDQPIPQVMMEALVIEVTKQKGKDFKTDSRWQFSRGPADPTVPVSGFLELVSGIWGFGYTFAGGLDTILASLKTLIDSGQAKVHATPRVATLSGETAEIFVGRDRYYVISPQNDSNGSPRLETLHTGVTLKFTPRVADNGEITVKIEPEVSEVAPVADDLPSVNRRKVSATVRVRDGETIVIGGLLLDSDQQVESKVPLLGDLPILGLLFRTTKRVAENTEVIIFITPRIVQPRP